MKFPLRCTERCGWHCYEQVKAKRIAPMEFRSSAIIIKKTIAATTDSSLNALRHNDLLSPTCVMEAQGVSDHPLSPSRLLAGANTGPMNAAQDSGFHTKRFVFLLTLPLLFLALNQSPTFSAQVDLLLQKFCFMVPAQYCTINVSAYER